MATNKRSKKSRYRGSKTHGGGAKKKRRGNGNRGGCGLAGTGKRAQAKKPTIWKNKDYFGKVGFIKKNKVIVTPINIYELNNLINDFKTGCYKEAITQSNDVFTVDLTKLGYNKLLGKGRVDYKVKIVCEKITDGAKNKIIND